MTVTDWPQVGQHAVALHACGELHRRLIQQGAQAIISREWQSAAISDRYDWLFTYDAKAAPI